MSNLRLHVDQSATSLQQPANPACADAPPVPSGRTPRPADACRLTLPVTLDVPNPPAPRQIALDRQGDHFVLSASNSPENLTWLASHQNLPAILEIARLSGALVRGTGRRAAVDPFTLGFFLWVSRYIITGRVPLDGSTGARINQMDLEGQLLELFTGNWAHGLAPLVGNINMLRREPSLTAETRERIQRVTGILDLVPQYRAFLAHFVSEAEQNNLTRMSDGDFHLLGWIFDFVRRSVLNRSAGRPLRYDAATLSAVRAYNELHRVEISAGTRPDFCAAVLSALRERGGLDAPAANFLEECRFAIELAVQPPQAALRESLRASLVSSLGLSRLQQAIAEESARVNMRIDWLRRRGSFGGVFSVLRESIAFVTGEEGGSTRLSFDIAQFRQRLHLMTSITERGEYDLAALAFLRTLFGAEGGAPRLRAFADGHFQDLEWDFRAGELGQIRELMGALMGRRRSAASFATTAMPALLGTGCALGTGGLILSHTLSAITQNRDLQLVLGSASAGLVGGGCLGLAGHYVWPAAVPRAVHNRYAWDLGSSGVGTGMGIATYLLINLLNAGAPGRANPRFPADPYGP